MPETIRVLFVDDDPKVRHLWATILSGEGFEVKVACSVSEALSRITGMQFDVLIADLNIGEPGDGFTVVSAMRRVQPQAVTMILTGYPAFQAALRAIHEQVDDFLTKPAEARALIQSVRDNLKRRRKRPAAPAVRLPHVITHNREAIIESWYKAVESSPEISAIPLSREDRIDHLPKVLEELVRFRAADHPVESDARASATLHGILRAQQGYTPSLLLEETRILHRVLANCLQENLLNVDISNLLPDLAEIDDRVHRMLRYSLEALVESSDRRLREEREKIA